MQDLADKTSCKNQGRKVKEGESLPFTR